MRKYYSSEIRYLHQIIVFEEFGFDWEYDEMKGEYFTTDPDNFEWWQALAKALEYIEEENIEVDYSYINELDDYIRYARLRGLK